MKANLPARWQPVARPSQAGGPGHDRFPDAPDGVNAPAHGQTGATNHLGRAQLVGRTQERSEQSARSGAVRHHDAPSEHQRRTASERPASRCSRLAHAKVVAAKAPRHGGRGFSRDGIWARPWGASGLRHLHVIRCLGADKNLAAEAAPTGVHPSCRSGFSRERSSSRISAPQEKTRPAHHAGRVLSQHRTPYRVTAAGLGSAATCTSGATSTCSRPRRSLLH